MKNRMLSFLMCGFVLIGAQASRADVWFAVEGGGMLGKIPALVWAAIEEAADAQIYELVDGFAGISAGGIDVGLATIPVAGGKPIKANLMAKFFEDRGAAIFGPAICSAIACTPQTVAATGKALQKETDAVFGAAKFSSALRPTKIFATDMVTRELMAFDSTKMVGSKEVLASLMVRATASVQNVFSPVQVFVGDKPLMLIDPGSFGLNDPTHELYKELKATGAEHTIYSFGTGFANWKQADKEMIAKRNAGDKVKVIRIEPSAKDLDTLKTVTGVKGAAMLATAAAAFSGKPIPKGVDTEANILGAQTSKEMHDGMGKIADTILASNEFQILLLDLLARKENAGKPKAAPVADTPAPAPAPTVSDAELAKDAALLGMTLERYKEFLGEQAAIARRLDAEKAAFDNFERKESKKSNGGNAGGNSAGGSPIAGDLNASPAELEQARLYGIPLDEYRRLKASGVI